MIYIYMILIVILDALQHKMFMVYERPHLWQYCDVFKYTHPRVTQKRSWHLARLVKASEQGKYIIPISGCELQIVASK
jgi:hypothetical protein